MKSVDKKSIRIATLAVMLALIACIATVMARAQTREQGQIEISHLDKFSNTADKVIDVTVGESVIRLAMAALSEKRSPDEAKIKEILSGLKGIYVKRFEFESEGAYTMSDVEAIRSQLSAPGWERVANVRSKREGNYDVVIMSEGTIVKGLAVLAAEPKALTVVNIVGAIDMSKLRDIQGKFGIPNFGLEQAPGVTVKENRKDKKPDNDQQENDSSDRRDEKKPPALIRTEKPPKE